MFISKPDEFGTISIYPHLTEAPTRETFMTTRIEIFDKNICSDTTRPIRLGSWYTPQEMLELALACQKAAEIAADAVSTKTIPTPEPPKE